MIRPEHMEPVDLSQSSVDAPKESAPPPPNPVKFSAPGPIDILELPTHLPAPIRPFEESGRPGPIIQLPFLGRITAFARSVGKLIERPFMRRMTPESPRVSEIKPGPNESLIRQLDAQILEKTPKIGSLSSLLYAIGIKNTAYGKGRQAAQQQLNVLTLMRNALKRTGTDTASYIKDARGFSDDERTAATVALASLLQAPATAPASRLALIPVPLRSDLRQK